MLSINIIKHRMKSKTKAEDANRDHKFTKSGSFHRKDGVVGSVVNNSDSSEDSRPKSDLS